MGTFSDQPNPVPYQMPPATGPGGGPIGPGSGPIGPGSGPMGPGGGMGGGKQLKIRGMANAAKQRGAQQIAQFKQMMTGTQRAAPGASGPAQISGMTSYAAAKLLVDKRDAIDRFTRNVIFG